MTDKTKSGLFAPPYYQEFVCKADKCRHNCCIGWEVDIDKATYAKYKRMKDIRPTVTVCDGTPCFAMREDGRCPHLSQKGLCDIILAHGETCIPEICQKHPRFFNRVGKDRWEAGLGIACEEACRLVLESQDPFTLIQIEPTKQKGGKVRFDVLPTRNEIFSVLGGQGTYDEKIAKCKEMFALSEVYTSDAWVGRLLALEILDGEWERDLRALQAKPLAAAELTDEYDIYCVRLLAYFVYRHVSVATDKDNLRARFAFAIWSVQTVRLLFAAQPERHIEVLADCARRYSAEIEYSADNTDELIFALQSALPSESADADI